MKNEEQPEYKYDFLFAGGDFNSYLFVTLQSIIYEVQFIPTSLAFFDMMADISAGK